MPRPHPATVLSLLALAVAVTLRAGPLDPPAGSVTSTYKTLTEVEPRIVISAANTPGTTTGQFRISQPGSYYLAGNLTGVASKAGIEIAASDVTLDLSGFRMQGVAGSLAAISVVGSQANVAIRNGTIRGWAGGGIAAATGIECEVERIRAFANTGVGIQIGSGSTIWHCRADSNSSHGISTSTDTLIAECSARLNGGTGITTNDHSLVQSTLVRGNTGAGLNLGAGNLVTDVVSGQNAVGVSAGSGLNAVDTISRDNNSHGFFCFGGSFTNCVSTSNTGEGFSIDASVVTGCRSSTNGGAGYLAGNNSLVAHSVSVGNGGVGIDAGIGGYALRNLCSGDCVTLTGAGIREIQFDGRGRADGNYLQSNNSNLWGVGGTSSTLMIGNSLNGGFVTTFGGYEGPDITESNIGTTCNPSGNYKAQ